jgi:hypothetical protein
MKGKFVQTTLNGEEELIKIVKSRTLGTNSNPIGFQPPLFKDNPLVFCSYVCEGYNETYVTNRGIVFETDSPVVYACPVDTFNLLRSSRWLPRYEQFIFPSIEKMLEKYPSPSSFKADFQKYFKNLNPGELYPENDPNFADSTHRLDYCLSKTWIPGCNEITFPKPLKVKNCRIFSSREELEHFLI